MFVTPSIKPAPATIASSLYHLCFSVLNSSTITAVIARTNHLQRPTEVEKWACCDSFKAALQLRLRVVDREGQQNSNWYGEREAENQQNSKTHVVLHFLGHAHSLNVSIHVTVLITTREFLTSVMPSAHLCSSTDAPIVQASPESLAVPIAIPANTACSESAIISMTDFIPFNKAEPSDFDSSSGNSSPSIGNSSPSSGYSSPLSFISSSSSIWRGV